MSNEESNKNQNRRYWNRREEKKLPVLTITIIAIICLSLAYMIGMASN